MADTDEASLTSGDHGQADVTSEPVSLKAKGKQRAVSQDDHQHDPDSFAQSAKAGNSNFSGQDALPSRSRAVIIKPSMPMSALRSPTPPRRSTSSPQAAPNWQPDLSHQPIEYVIRPAATSIAPSTSMHALIASSMSRSSSSSSSGIIERPLNDDASGHAACPPRKRRRQSSSSHASTELDEDGRSDHGGSHIPLVIRAGLRIGQNPRRPENGVVDLTEEASPDLIPIPLPTLSRPMSRVEGNSTSNAILIGDSPTPPLRPIASPLARSAAAAKARSHEQAESTGPKTLFGALTCPVCLGPPVPLVLTECGHAL